MLRVATRVPQPLVLSVLSRTVANTLSMTLVLLRVPEILAALIPEILAYPIREVRNDGIATNAGGTTTGGER